MSAADEDTELRDLLIQTLDKNGVLGKIKAELRASIFLALESVEDKAENPIRNSALQKFLSGSDGKLCVGIIKQFLEHFSLEYTLAVFSPEVNYNDSFPDEKEVANTLSLATDSPFLQQIVSTSPKKSALAGLDDGQMSFLKSKFSSFDHASAGTINKNDVATVMTLACPLMKKELIHDFAHDELKTMPSQKVSFDVFLSLFKKFRDMCSSVVNIGGQSKLRSLPLHQPTGNSSLGALHSISDSLFGVNLSSNNKIELSSKNNQQLGDVGVPSAYLLPINTPEKESRGLGPDSFLGSDVGGNLRTMSVDPMYTHVDTPAISPTSSKHDSDLPRKRPDSADAPSEQQQYDDDFNSEQSITEDIQDIADDLLQSEKDESLDFTDDRTVSDTPRADYTEDIKHG